MGKKTKNILFVMYDQLRFDYLSCTGHPHLDTPNFDRVAAMGVQFSRTYVQSPICGSSRMCFYTGRYAHSHGAQWNNFPLKVGEMTLGDHLRPLGMDAWLIGKTHMMADADGMARLGLEPDSQIGARVAECGFDAWVRHDGLVAQGPDGFYDEKRMPYNEYLHQKGYESENPWADFANAGLREDGHAASGFFMRHAEKPANIRNEDSETPWLTDRTIDFLNTRGDTPWLAHVSFIKPHWPYIVPKPYHKMYGHNQVLPAVRVDTEREDTHPIYAWFMNNPVGSAFARPEVRDVVIPAYMGLIKQCDDELGRLLDHLESSGQLNDTMIVLTSDHGDYLGDHWLGEKNLFHDPSVRIPLIVYDPSEAADATRGTVVDALVESVDLAATFVEVAGGEVPDNIIEGQSLMPFLRGETPAQWRDYVVSEYDYAGTPAVKDLDVDVKDARLFMIADDTWKFVHAEGGMRPLLFNLQDDPQELNDLMRFGAFEAGAHGEVLDMMYGRLRDWGLRNAQRTAISDAQIADKRGKSRRQGIILGLYDEDDIETEIGSHYSRPIAQDFTS